VGWGFFFFFFFFCCCLGGWFFFFVDFLPFFSQNKVPPPLRGRTTRGEHIYLCLCSRRALLPSDFVRRFIPISTCRLLSEGEPLFFTLCSPPICELANERPPERIPSFPPPPVQHDNLILPFFPPFFYPLFPTPPLPHPPPQKSPCPRLVRKRKPHALRELVLLLPGPPSPGGLRILSSGSPTGDGPLFFPRSPRPSASSPSVPNRDDPLRRTFFLCLLPKYSGPAGHLDISLLSRLGLSPHPTHLPIRLAPASKDDMLATPNPSRPSFPLP